jgi:hypothetical protein
MTGLFLALFPEREDKPLKERAGTAVSIPNSGKQLITSGPAGNVFLVKMLTFREWSTWDI